MGMMHIVRFAIAASRLVAHTELLSSNSHRVAVHSPVASSVAEPLGHPTGNGSLMDDKPISMAFALRWATVSK